MNIRYTIPEYKEFISSSHDYDYSMIYEDRKILIDQMWENNQRFEQDEYSKISNIYSDNLDKIRNKYKIFY